MHKYVYEYMYEYVCVRECVCICMCILKIRRIYIHVYEFMDVYAR